MRAVLLVIASLLVSVCPMRLSSIASTRAATLVFEPPTAASSPKKLVLCGRKASLLSEAALDLLPAEARNVWSALVESVKAGDLGDAASTIYLSKDGGAATVVAGVLPAQRTDASPRNN